MEKYYKVNDVKDVIKKLAKEPAYQHNGEDFMLEFILSKTRLQT